MKFLLLLGLFLLIGYCWRSLRSAPARVAAPAAGAAPEPAPAPTMLRCLHCGVHLPPADAITGHAGVYCSEAHRAIRER